MVSLPTLSSEYKDVHDHPVVRAWSELGVNRTIPKGVAALKESKKKTAKSAVYRLEGVPRKGCTIIAKKAMRWSAMIESIVYEKIMPQLPVRGLKYYGLVDEPQSQFCWIFLEDAGDHRYCALKHQHRRLAGRWLGLLHTSAAGLKELESLPERGVEHYFARLQNARRRITTVIDESILNPETLVMLDAVVSHLDSLECNWGEIVQSCALMPRTLVHGDFVQKNLLITEGQQLRVLDWETGGVGVPAADLAQTPCGGSLATLSAAPEMEVYWSTVRKMGDQASLKTTREMARVGTVFRLIAALNWETERLIAGGNAQRCIRRIDGYRRGLGKCRCSGII